MALLVGLTGRMGSGKTLVAEMFRKRSAYIIEADTIARNLVSPGQPALDEILKIFGKNILLKSGELNRSQLGNLVFNDPGKRKLLENILHPRIINEERNIYKRIIDVDPNALVILDAALLIESENHKNMDKVIVVLCSEDESISRIIKRNGLTKKEIKNRFISQMKIEEKIKYADLLIDNNGSIDKLEIQVERIYKEIIALC